VSNTQDSDLESGRGSLHFLQSLFTGRYLESQVGQYDSWNLTCACCGQQKNSCSWVSAVS